MNEDDTFNKLKRTPLDQMTEILREMKSPVVPRPVLSLGGVVIENSSMYIQLMRNHHWITVLKENGWDYMDYLREVEKETIRGHIDEYNSAIEFPQSIIDHAREFFPNIKFTPAKIELE